jgi:hypothetical protein
MGDYESVRAQARERGRDKRQVSHALGNLAEHGLVSFETEDRSKRPLAAQKHIGIELPARAIQEKNRAMRFVCEGSDSPTTGTDTAFTDLVGHVLVDFAG